jgi:hypothetical protein
MVIDHDLTGRYFSVNPSHIMKMGQTIGNIYTRIDERTCRFGFPPIKAIPVNKWNQQPQLGHSYSIPKSKQFPSTPKAGMLAAGGD